MTKAASINQSDVDRVMKAATAQVVQTGLAAKITFRLRSAEVEVILGGKHEFVSNPAMIDHNPWDEE